MNPSKGSDAGMHIGNRIFILGAGFSKPAGLPLGNELFKEIYSRIESRKGRDSAFHSDLRYYIKYRKLCDGVDIDECDVDLEDFMSYLDIEHYLGLRGKDTVSSEGNAAQILTKRYLAQIIQERTPAADRLPDEYYQFARNLTTDDYVITFNYDIILERALEFVGKPYRLFPHRYESIDSVSGFIGDSKDELVISKMHGSVDWFDEGKYRNWVACWEKQGSKRLPPHPIFNDPDRYGVSPLVDGPRRQNDPLVDLSRIRRADEFYVNEYPPETPFILSPSHAKIVYASPLHEFWFGLGQAGGLNLGVSVIGYSLPDHDEYIRISLFELIRNYQQVEWDLSAFGTGKDYVRLVDSRKTKNEVNDYKSRYRFVDMDKTRMFFGGFGTEAVDFLFSDRRTM
ncbi:MAG: hypothetical protein ABIK83_15305 [Candidatus Zixiibacteriota bacterium]